MPLQFTTSSQQAHTNGHKVLIYGGAGQGKTCLTATLPRPVLFSAESGALSLSRANLERLYGVGNPLVTYDVPMILIYNLNDLNDAYAWATQSAEAKGFDSFALDSLSEIAEVVLNSAKRTVKDPRQAYGELIEKMETLVRSFRDISGKHIYMSAKMEPMKDEASGIVKYGPSMPGSKLGAKLPYFFDEVFRLGTNKAPDGTTFRFLQTQPDMQYEAKDRSGALAAMEPPFLTTLFNKIQGVQ